MKHIAFVVFALSLCAVPIWAGTSMSDDARSSASNIQTFSENYFYAASSPVDIQLPGFTLIADSGSLKYEIEINVSKLPYKDGTAMQSNMENVSWMGDGMRLLPNGEHFSDSAPALISLAYDPDRIPMGYKPTDVYTYYCDDSHSWHRLKRKIHQEDDWK